MIQILRGTSTQRASQTQSSVIGQPLYETDTKKLYIGDGSTAINELHAVNPGVDISFIGTRTNDSIIYLTADLDDFSKQPPFSPSSGVSDPYYAGKYAVMLGENGGALVRLGNFATGGNWGCTIIYSEGFSSMGNFMNSVVDNARELSTLSATVSDLSGTVSDISNTITDISRPTIRSNAGNIGYSTPAANTTIADETWTGTSSGYGTDVIAYVTISGPYFELDYNAVGGTYANGDTYGSIVRLQRNVSGTWQQVDNYSNEEQVVDNFVTPISHSFGSAYQSGDRYQIYAYVSRRIPPVAIAFNAICTYKEIGVDGDGNTLADIRISGVPNITESPTPSNALINTAALANVIGVNGISFSQLNTRATVASLNSNVYTAYLDTANNCVGLRTMGTSRGVTSVTYSDSPVDITIYGAQIS